jgi:centrosomal protein CEP41
MERTVPKSKKYEHVQGKLDTGLNVNKVRTVTAREYTRRRDEIFFRITKTNLYELYNEYEADEHEMISEAIIGTENGPRIVTHSDDSRALYNKPYLILDVRDTESFNTYHLLQARSYPDTMMRRDFVHPEFFAFKNKPQTLIIVYCDDERISQESAKVLVDRGADNIYLLSGGIQEFAAHFPSFIEGNIPECVQSRKTSG